MHKLRLTFFMIAILAFSLLSQAQKNDTALMPIPESIKFTENAFELTEILTVGFSGLTSERLVFNANRFVERLAGRTGLFFKQGIIHSGSNSDTSNVIISIEREGKLVPGEDESYSISISENQLKLEAVTDFGAARGLETILQLLTVENGKYIFPGCEVIDAPRFVWRGLLIDVCRHFMPVEMVKRNLRGLAAVKMNVVHLHLSEDQGFRVESKKYPKLTGMGSDGLYYTQEQVKDIVKYASLLGIRVIPEFDIPGHATSWLVGYPELGSKEQEYSIERTWGVFDATLNPIKERTYEFLDTLLTEMSTLFPDEYFHIGGDENSGKHWDENIEIQSFMLENNIKDNHALQAYFNQRVLKILTNNNKKMIGWDEIQHENMPRNIVIQSWRGKSGLEKAAKDGFQVILSNGYYIDLIHPAEEHYLNDPLPSDIALTAEEQKRVLGGEATMWAEFVNNETVDSRIWPRTAAIAERLWSKKLTNDIPDMYSRLEKVSRGLEELGITHIKNRDMLLRGLSSNNVEHVKILSDVLEPLKDYRRGRYKPYTQQSPLTRMVDASIPDAPGALKFRLLVDDLKSNKISNEILSLLEMWSGNNKILAKVIDNNPILEEIRIHSTNLSVISGELLRIIKGEIKVNDSEIESLIENARVNDGQLELKILEPAQKILEYFN